MRSAKFYSAEVLVKRTAERIPAGRTGQRPVFHSHAVATANTPILSGAKILPNRISSRVASNRPGTALPLNDDKGVVVPILRPRPVRDLFKVHKTPVGHVGVTESEKITYRG